MTYNEDSQIRLRRQRSKQAIALAMQGRWHEAIATNQEIIASFPNDVEAYNRLGRAYMELGMYPQAKEAYTRSIEIDPYNTISKKNLQRLSHLRQAPSVTKEDTHAEPHHFIEEVGKTGLVEIQNLGAPEVIARTTTGDKVNLSVDGTNLIVENGQGEYLGQVENKLGQRLIKLMDGGNQYTAAILSSEENQLTIIIREIYQDPSQTGILSFPTKVFKSPRPYVTNKLFKDELEYEEILPEDAVGFDEDQASEQE